MVLSYVRMFIVEVMGCDCGDLVLWVGLFVGVEMIVLLEVNIDIKDVVEKIEQGIKRGKKYFIVMVVEGCMSG